MDRRSKEQLPERRVLATDRPASGPHMMYLKLVHGRSHPGQEMNDWGEDGPVFGPLAVCHTTYGSDVKLEYMSTSPGEPEQVLELTVRDGLMYYGNMWYGDWSVVFTDREQVTTLFSAAAAKAPHEHLQPWHSGTLKSIRSIERERAVSELAMRFATELGEKLSSEDMDRLVERNGRDPKSAVCHSHDFCDANVVMEEAWRRSFGGELFDEEEAEQLSVWNEAWQIARDADFDVMLLTLEIQE